MKFNQVNKELILTKQTYGAVVKKGIVYDTTHEKKREIEAYTIIRIIDFNFFTKKIVIECVKGVEQYTAEVDLDFLVEHCKLNVPDKNQEVGAILVQHVKHNFLDKDTAIFIVVMVLTYLVGLVLGKGF